ncbi:hypothetical protein [Bacillus sp. B1-b2]|uniref:hypothetical protein n=1 Tax=Bacillus sp. B1-b2 TaxID=2653201 RepID=UPI001261BFA8|nr:hypothetical protein [Bacillus sp. B1-b2]KAB7671152.1 hypothetical protein F9279_06455 [Bacillus sp. B1-b2]
MHTIYHSEKSGKIYLPASNKNHFHNQTHYQHSYMKSYLSNQQQQTEKLTSLIEALQAHTLLAQDYQKDKIDKMEQNLTNHHVLTGELSEKLSILNEQTNSIYAQLTDMEQIQAKQKEIIHEESLRNTALFDQIINQDRDISHLTEKTDEFSILANEVKEKMHQSEVIYTKLEEKLILQEVFHQTILENIEDTNGNVSKLSRQLDHIKEVIFERIHYLTSKLEENMKSIARPVQRFFIKLDQQEKDEKL